MDWMLGAPKLPKVVKVNHRAHIHPLAREASQSAKQRRAAKTNTRRSPGRPFFRGRLHGSWSDRPASARMRERPIPCQALLSGIQNTTGGRSSVLSLVDAAHWNHRGACRTRGRDADRFRRRFPSVDCGSWSGNDQITASAGREKKPWRPALGMYGD